MNKITTVKTTCSRCGRPVFAGGNIQPPKGRVVCLWCAIGYSGTREKESMKYGILVFSES
jgi:hypothetical protein